MARSRDSWAPVLVFAGVIALFSGIAFGVAYFLTPSEPEKEKGGFWRTVGQIAGVIVAVV